jgi:rhodanese-related sulfurtransferase
VADAATERTDTGSSSVVPDVAPDVLAAPADTTGPESPAAAPDTAPDLASRKDDAAVPDALVSDTVPSKGDTGLADVMPAAAEVAAPDGKTGATCAQETFVHLSPSELKTLLDGGEDPFLINVKGSSIKNIPGTDAVLANDVPGIEALVKNDVCANIVLYCRSGGTSQTVGSQLITKGYRRVRDLAGGITAWEAAGYPTE